MRGNEKRRILKALAEAALGPVEPELGDTEFYSAFDAIVASLPERDRRLLAVLIQVLQISPVLFLRGRNFTGLSPAAREEHLRRLATSRWGVWRRSVSVLRTLVGYAYYGQSAAWSKIGYDGPWLGRIVVEALPDPELGETT